MNEDEIPREYILVLNLKSKLTPCKIEFPDGEPVHLTREYLLPFSGIEYFPPEEWNELDGLWGRENWLAFVVRPIAGQEGGRAKLKMVVSAIRILRAQWVGIGLGWSGEDQTEATKIFGQTAASVWISGGDIAMGYILDHSNPCELGTNDLKHLRETTCHLARLPEASDEEQIRISRALDRLDSFFDRVRDEDKIVDLTIALEALYINGWERLKEKLSSRASRFLETTAERQEMLESRIRTWYDERSTILHGGTGTDSAGVAKQMKRVVQRSLRKALADPASLAGIRRDI